MSDSCENNNHLNTSGDQNSKNPNLANSNSTENCDMENCNSILQEQSTENCSCTEQEHCETDKDSTNDFANPQVQSDSCPTKNKNLSAAAICALCVCTTLIVNILTYSFIFAFQSKTVFSQKQYLTPSQNNSSTVISSVSSAGGNLSTAEIYSQNVNSVVGISTENTYYNVFGQTSTYASSGTGFIISTDGYIVTNYHVVESGKNISVALYNGNVYPATLVGHESSNDIAVLKIDAPALQALTAGDSSSLQVGQSICAIGNPLGELTYTLTSGVISALGREINIDGQPIKMFQIDAAVSPGNSGGPIFNSEGQVVGIVTAKYTDSGVEGIGFAIALNDITNIVNDIISYGYVKGKAYFGIGVQSAGNPQGAYITSITPDSCAEKAGLKVGDIITYLGDVQITSASQLISEKQNYKAGDTVVVKVFRNSETIVFTVIFDEELPSNTTDNSAEQQQQQQQQYYYDQGSQYSPYYYYR